jgi:mono/diheme cytochrome c family protein
MLPRSMPRRLLLIVLPALLLAACGSNDYGVSKFGDDGPQKVAPALARGEKIFNQRCGGCHTFDTSGTEGSAVRANSREYKDGPNFNVRREKYPDVLYAIHNGGFSSGPMPQNIVVGHDAEIVACFVATYSGKKAVQPPSPGNAPATGSGQDNCAQQLAQK